MVNEFVLSENITVDLSGKFQFSQWKCFLIWWNFFLFNIESVENEDETDEPELKTKVPYHLPQTMKVQIQARKEIGIKNFFTFDTLVRWIFYIFKKINSKTKIFYTGKHCTGRLSFAKRCSILNRRVISMHMYYSSN